MQDEMNVRVRISRNDGVCRRRSIYNDEKNEMR